MVQYPIEFDATVWKDSDDPQWHIETTEGLTITGDEPVSFGGTDDNPSPEDLFTASIASCIVSTFTTIAERKELEYDAIEAETEAVLDRGEDTRPVITEATIDITVFGVTDTNNAGAVEQATRKNCFIHNSVKTEVEISFTFEEMAL
ncbi:MAG: OsmC family protein [Candidatus Nanohaloarchaeota archaeon QJJ-5]|nr:OsmC family protein [Candidatus Nanohaloarchaeota archaeon QJJ-5]